MKRYLLDSWNILIAQVGPTKEEDPDSYMHAQRFFYAGALALRDTMFEKTSQGEEISKDDEQLLNDLHDELQAYAEGVINDPENFVL